LFVLIDAREQVTQVISGELPQEGPRGRVAAFLEAGQSLLDLGQVGEVAGRHDLALHHREKDLDWFSLEACTGVCTIAALGNRRASRSIAAWPRWEDPLSTTQNTRFAEAYGSRVITCPASAMNGTTPVEGAQEPKTRA
jgi:hypothetical protein